MCDNTYSLFLLHRKGQSMRDYTEFFKAALRAGADYSADDVQNALSAHDNICCTDDMDCNYENWLFIYGCDGMDFTDFYGYLSMRYPAALLKADCPAQVKEILAQNHVIYTALEEPMCCDAEILRRFAPQSAYIIFNEDALLSGDISPDDAHFLLVLERLETGRKCYVDAGDFCFGEINR